MNSIKNSITLALADKTFDCPEDEVILSTIVHETIKNLDSATISSTLDSVISIKQLSLTNLKTGYIAYAQAIKLIDNYNRFKINEYYDNEITTLYTILSNTTKVEPFNNITFSQYMYNITDLSLSAYSRLQTIHYAFFAPIATYYSEIYNIPPYHLRIHKIDHAVNNPGKIVTFKIHGVTNKHLTYTIKSKYSKYIESVKTEGDAVKVILSV